MCAANVWHFVLCFAANKSRGGGEVPLGRRRICHRRRRAGAAVAVKRAVAWSGGRVALGRTAAYRFIRLHKRRKASRATAAAAAPPS